MMKIGMLQVARSRRVKQRSTGLPLLALLVLGGTAASATALMSPSGVHTAGFVRVVALSEEAPFVAPAPLLEQASAPGQVRQIPLVAGYHVAPTPAALPKAAPLPVQAAAVPIQPIPAPSALPVAAPPAAAPALMASSQAPLDCLAPGLKAVLQDVQARFGAVTLVSTTHLHTDNHSRGSARHKLHGDCRAVDFKVAGDLNAVIAYLRSRPEVSGINTYRNNGVIHIDATANRALAQR